MQKAEERRIGGIFAPEQLADTPNGLADSLASPCDEVLHMMSGRCGILLAIRDWMAHDEKRVAYLPAYTCETVSGPFVKSGYDVRYYDLDRDLRPRYDESLLDEISLVLICGYYGFPTWDDGFAAKCREKGIGVILDATHSIFSRDGAGGSARYVAASFRKWFPVISGGVAVKRGGAFLPRPEPFHTIHITLRERYMRLAGEAVGADTAEARQLAGDAFWDAELLLRDIYGAQESDESSISVVNHYPVGIMKEKRMQNYAALLAAFPKTDWAQPVFRRLPEGVCPSHFPVYTERREALQEMLRDRNIASTVYWPVPPFIDIDGYPGAKWIYGHILALPCDQRHTPADMERIAQVLRETPVPSHS